MKLPVGSPLPKTKLISVETIRKSQEITESTGNSDPARIFQEEKERVSHVGSLKSIEISQNRLVESNPLPLFSSLHNQSVQKLAENCLGSDGVSSLNKPDSSETVGAIKMSQDSHKAISSSSLMNLVHGKNLVCSARWQPKRKKDTGTLGTICCPKTAPILPSPSLPCLEGLIISPVPDQSAQSSPMKRQPSDTLSSNSLPKTVKLLKPVSQDGCKVISSLPSICSFHDQPAEKSRTKQSAVSPFPKTKMVWVESARKSQEITRTSGITEPVKISLGEKEAVSRVSEIIMQLRVQDTQESIKSFEKGSLNPLPSKKIWVKELPEPLQSTEVKNPISVSFNKEPDSREIITQLRDMQIDSEIDDESTEFPRITKKYKLPVYPIPEHLKGLIENDMVPEVLWKPLTPETYTDYFAALLYAEDFYHEKWADYLLEGVTLQLHEQKAKKKRDDNNVSNRSHLDEDTKLFVKFKIDSVPERRPYLLSRDFVFLRLAGKDSTTFEGRFCRVMKSTHALAEFGDDLYSQYSPDHKYDVSFSFNRVCLKRSHQAVASAADPSFLHILFPGKFFPASQFSSRQHSSGNRMTSDSVVRRITTVQGHSPYLVTGPPTRHSPMMGDVVTKSALQIYRDSPTSRILICAQRNRTCDALAADLNEEIPDSELFRANAAFRELLDVDDEVIPLCSYDGECFTTPSLCELQNFRVVTSTFVSSFRLHGCGIDAGHFTHIFLVDASSATEPESMIPLANLVGERTTVVILGCPLDRPEWVRSNIARENGLKRSYFQRLLGSEPYRSNDPLFVAHLDCSEWERCDDLRYSL